MPAILHQSNHTMASPTDGLTNSSKEPRIRTLLFNIVIVFLAAASLVVACMQFMHQRKASRAPQDGTAITAAQPLREDGEPNCVHVGVPSNSIMQEDDMGDSVEMEEREDVS